MDQLESFLASLYGDMSGFVYVATKTPKTLDTPEAIFFEWPTQRDEMATYIREASNVSDVWVNPCLWLDKRVSKKTFRGSRWIWADFNGKPDSRMDFFPPIGMKIETSTGRSHSFWRLPDFQNDSEKLERYNKRLALNFLSNFATCRYDSLLRPPGTVNHRTGDKVTMGLQSDAIATYESLMGLDDPTSEDFVKVDFTQKRKPVWSVTTLLDEKTAELAFEPGAPANRVQHLIDVACGCVKNNLDALDTVVMVQLADKKLKVFQYRDDAERQIVGLISLARKLTEVSHKNKTLYGNVYSIVDLTELEEKIEYVIPNVLTTTGLGMVFARPNVGKSRFSLQMAQAIALKKRFAGFPVKRSGKMLFISNEMNHIELKAFVKPMLNAHTKDEIEHLRQNVFAYASDSGLSLEDPNGMDNLIRLIERIEPQGIFFDSLIATAGDPTQLGFMNDLFGRMREIQTIYDLFTWWIHHPRKENQKDHKPRHMDDVYGCRAVTSAPSVIVGLWQDQPNSNEPVELNCIKNRFGPYFEDRMLQSNQHLGFEPSIHLGQKVHKSLEEIMELANDFGTEPMVPSQKKENENGDVPYSF